MVLATLGASTFSAGPAGANVHWVTPGPQSPNPVMQGSTATYTVVVVQDNEEHADVLLTASGLPAGATFSGTSPVNGSEPCAYMASNATVDFTVKVHTTLSTPVGTHAWHVTATKYTSNDSMCTGTGSQPKSGDASLVVSAGVVSTTTTLTSSANPSVTGQPVTFTATVTTGATGNVEFFNGATPIADCGGATGEPLSGTTPNTAGCTTSFSASGSPNSITAKYLGTAGYTGSTSSPLSQVVNKADTTTTITGTTPNPVVGQPITVSVSVAPVTPGAGTPTGTVTITDGTQSCPAVLSGGSGNCALTETAAGPVTFTASYPDDANFKASSTTGGTGITVNKADTAVHVTSSANASTPAHQVTFTATVTSVAPGAGTPAGGVTFVDDGATLCNAAPMNGSGKATCTAFIPVKITQAITANYLGNANYNPSSGTFTRRAPSSRSAHHGKGHGPR